MLSDVDIVLKNADEQMMLAEQVDDIPAAAEAQRTAIYTLLRQLLIEVHALRSDR